MLSFKNDKTRQSKKKLLKFLLPLMQKWLVVKSTGNVCLGKVKSELNNGVEKSMASPKRFKNNTTSPKESLEVQLNKIFLFTRFVFLVLT